MTTLDRSDVDRWMAAAADGDRRAIAPLFHALWPLAVRYAVRLVRDASLAEDCAQDALVQLFGQLERYERGRDALTWALTLVTWQCRTAQRRRARRGEQAPDHTGAPAPTIDGRGLPPAGSAAGWQRGLIDGPGLPPAGSAAGWQRGWIDGASVVEHRDLVRTALAALASLGPRDVETITLAITDADHAATTPATFRKRLERALARLRTSWRSRHGTL